MEQQINIVASQNVMTVNLSVHDIELQWSTSSPHPQLLGRQYWDSKLHLESGLSLVKKQLGLQVYTLGLGWRWAPLMSDADDKMADYITVGDE